MKKNTWKKDKKEKVGGFVWRFGKANKEVNEIISKSARGEIEKDGGENES